MNDFNLRDCNTTSPAIQAAPSPWDVAADEVLREHAGLWSRLSLTDSLGSTEALAVVPIVNDRPVVLGMEFQHYLDEQMRDPEFRFWWYFHTPEFWLRSKLASLLFWLARMVHGGALWVIGVSSVDVEDET